VIFIVLTSAAGNVVYELLKQWFAAWGIAVGMVLAVFLLGISLSRKIAEWWRMRNQVMRVDFDPKVSPAKALVVLVSKAPGSSSALEAALYHARDESLQHLWLITSKDAASEAELVKHRVLSMHPKVQAYEVILDDIFDINHAQRVVGEIRDQALGKAEISEEDVMFDFTGMTKQASAGMVSVCAATRSRLQFMQPKGFLVDGRADPSAGSEPREVRVLRPA